MAVLYFWFLSFSLHGILDIEPPPPVPTWGWVVPPVASSTAALSILACISQTCSAAVKQAFISSYSVSFQTACLRKRSLRSSLTSEICFVIPVALVCNHNANRVSLRCFLYETAVSTAWNCSIFYGVPKKILECLMNDKRKRGLHNQILVSSPHL